MGKNVPVSFEDVDLMEKIFQKDVATLKGKLVKPHPPVINKNDIIELPPELNVKGRKAELAIDVVYINDQSFLHSVDRTIKLRGLSHLGTRKKGQNYDKVMLLAGLDIILRHYNKHDIFVSLIHADNEFRSLFNMLADDWDINFNYCLPGEHVPDIERFNRLLQERFRVTLYRLPYKVIPRLMVVKLALRITRIANFFPAKGGIICHYPTATIVSGKQINFDRELVYSFGDYVQACYESRPKNNNLPRTKDCIYLQSTDTLQRGDELMDLSTGELIRCTRVDKCVMTQLVIDRVEEPAVKQGYCTLKFFNRKNQELVL